MRGPEEAARVLWVDATATAATRLRTGIQRVVRGLVGEGARSSGRVVLPAVAEGEYRPASQRERRRLGAEPSAGGAGWGSVPPRAGDQLLLAEILDRPRITLLERLLARSPGERPAVIGIVHDALSWTSPQWTPPERREGFAEYLGVLARCDRVLVPSAFTARELRRAWAEGAAEPGVPLPEPEIRPWPVDAVFREGGASPREGGALPREGRESAGPPWIACVGTLEARKNQGSLLEACERLWAEGYDFRLELVGRQRARSDREWPDRIRHLRRRGRPLRWRERVGEEELVALYRRATLSVYPSLAEGFGLPIAESLACGCPCVCGGFGAMGEVAAGGGCLSLAELAAGDLERALAGLLGDPAECDRLRREAAGREWPGWADWIAGLPARPS